MLPVVVDCGNTVAAYIRGSCEYVNDICLSWASGIATCVFASMQGCHTHKPTNPLMFVEWVVLGVWQLCMLANTLVASHQDMGQTKETGGAWIAIV